jgi:hypothetical protein
MCNVIITPIRLGWMQSVNCTESCPDSCLEPGGVLVCPSGFTADAIAFGRDRGIVLRDQHYLFEILDG